MPRKCFNLVTDDEQILLVVFFKWTHFVVHLCLYIDVLKCDTLCHLCELFEDGKEGKTFKSKCKEIYIYLHFNTT